MSKLKNITIVTGTYDILNPDVHLLKEKAEKVGVGHQINIKEYEQAGHIWIIEKNSSQELIQRGYQDILDTLMATLGQAQTNQVATLCLSQSRQRGKEPK